MKKKLLSILLVLSLMLALVPAAFAVEPASGTCGADGDGSNVTWTLDASGTLTFTGTGAIRDYASSAPPWRYSAVTVVVGEGITRLGAYMLAGSTVTSVSLPSTLTDVDTQALNGCRYLTGITFPDGVKTIGEQALSNCTSLTSVTLPASVETIGDRAFMGCTMLASVTIPEGPTHLGTNLFRGDWELKSILLPQSLTQLDESVFSSCGIETITIPDNVTVIGKKAFFASGLTDISIPAGVTDIGDRAFSQTRLTSVTVPATIRSFGKYIFSECVDLHTAVLAEGITRVSDGMFRDCTNLADVTLPQTLTAIAQQAFSGCTDLEHIALPETTVKYGACAFSGTYLTDVRFPAGTSYLGKGVLSNMPVLQQITLPDGLTSVGAELFLGDKELKEVTLPSGLTAVSDGMFSGCTALQSIDLPDTVAYIGESAFSGCTALTDLTFPAGLESFGREALQGCSSLTEITVPTGVHALPEAVFSGCSRLVNVNLPEGLTSIGPTAFQSCINLREISIPDSVQAIHGSAFEWALRLSDIRVGAGNPTYHTVDGVLMTKDGYELTAYPAGRPGIRYDVPDGIVEIAPSAFYGSGLVAVRCPDSLRKIGRTAFANNERLRYVQLPAGMQSIETWAFSGSDNITDVCFGGSEEAFHALCDPDYVFPSRVNVHSYSYMVIPGAAELFTDVDADSWAIPGIDFCVLAGLMSGVGGNAFAPKGVTTRAQVVQILYNLSGCPKAYDGSPFTDLTADWYQHSIVWAYQNGIVSGTSATTFDPDAPITRQDFTVILYEQSGRPVTTGSALTAFPDVGSVAGYAYAALTWAVEQGLVSGVGADDGVRLTPRGYASRAQVAAILMLYCDRETA